MPEPVTPSAEDWEKARHLTKIIVCLMCTAPKPCAGAPCYSIEKIAQALADKGAFERATAYQVGYDAGKDSVETAVRAAAYRAGQERMRERARELFSRPGHSPVERSLLPIEPLPPEGKEDLGGTLRIIYRCPVCGDKTDAPEWRWTYPKQGSEP